jgi:hypothetical protein
MGKKIVMFTDDSIIDALKTTRGNMALAAKKVGCSYDTVLDRVKGSKDLQAVLNEAREGFLDTADLKLQEAVDRGESWAIQFALKTIGKVRGYGDTLSIKATVEPRNWDMSKLSTEELRELRRLHEKAEIIDGESRLLPNPVDGGVIDANHVPMLQGGKDGWDDDAECWNQVEGR